MDGVLRFCFLGLGIIFVFGFVAFERWFGSFHLLPAQFLVFFLSFFSRSCMEHDGMKETKITLQTGNMAYTNWGGEKKGGHVLFVFFVVIVRGIPTLDRYFKTIVSCILLQKAPAMCFLALFTKVTAV